jgi:hypothetical protein
VTSPSGTGDAFESNAAEHKEIAIAILEGMGLEELAELLRAAEMSYVFSQWDNWNGGTAIYQTHLTVDVRRLGEYTQENINLIDEAIEKIIPAYNAISLGRTQVVPRLTSTEQISNQAVSPPAERHPFQRHGMRFRGQTELLMFDSLVKKQQQLPRADTILIVPLPSVWNGRQRWEPDFIVTYRGRAGVIEIDDPTHARRYVADKSRDQVLEECGIHLIRRIAVEDAAQEPVREEFIELFLQRLASR